MTAPTYDATTKAARMTATRDTVANGTLEILSAGSTVLAIFGLSATGGTVTGAVWNLAFDASTVAGEAGAGAGTVATQARVKDSGGTVRISGLSVGTSGSAVNLDNTNISSGQNVTLSSGTVTHAVDPA
jgi:hypothetical protein